MNGNLYAEVLKWSLFVLFAVAGSCFVSGCTAENEQTVRKKLDVICSGDLAALTDSIAVENLIEKPYYKIAFYKRYNEGKYSRKAIAEFYFLKKVTVKVVRKYRYLQTVGMWDRYYNEYVFIHDTTSVTAEDTAEN